MGSRKACKSKKGSATEDTKPAIFSLRKRALTKVKDTGLGIPTDGLAKLKNHLQSLSGSSCVSAQKINSDSSEEPSAPGVRSSLDSGSSIAKKSFVSLTSHLNTLYQNSSNHEESEELSYSVPDMSDTQKFTTPEPYASFSPTNIFKEPESSIGVLSNSINPLFFPEINFNSLTTFNPLASKSIQDSMVLDIIDSESPLKVTSSNFLQNIISRGQAGSKIGPSPSADTSSNSGNSPIKPPPTAAALQKLITIAPNDSSAAPFEFKDNALYTFLNKTVDGKSVDIINSESPLQPISSNFLQNLISRGQASSTTGPSPSAVTPSNSGNSPIKPPPTAAALQKLITIAPNDSSAAPFEFKENVLYTFLNKTSDGKSILAYYKKHRYLNKRKRGLLSDLVIRSELEEDPSKKFGKDAFTQMADVTCELFPNEVPETYYKPFCSSDGERDLAKGKYYDKYCNLRKIYREDGLIDRERPGKKLETTRTLVIYNTETLSDDAYVKEIHWLQTQIEPWCLVKEKWESTAHRRLNDFDSSGLSIEVYISAFRVLQLSEASELILIDFDVKFPGKGKLLIECWPTFRNSIFTYSAHKLKEDRSFADSIKFIDLDFDTKDDDKTSLAALLLFLHITPLTICVSKKGKKKKDVESEDGDLENWRPSRSEVVNFFILIVPVGEAVDTALEDRIKLLKKKQKCQPFIVVVQNRVSTQYFVYFNSKRYYVKTLVSAIDLNFKIFTVFNAKYPIPDLVVWKFLQKFVFEIDFPQDKSYPSLTTLANSLGLINKS